MELVEFVSLHVCVIHLLFFVLHFSCCLVNRMTEDVLRFQFAKSVVFRSGDDGDDGDDGIERG